MKKLRLFTFRMMQLALALEAAYIPLVIIAYHFFGIQQSLEQLIIVSMAVFGNIFMWFRWSQKPSVETDFNQKTLDDYKKGDC